MPLCAQRYLREAGEDVEEGGLPRARRPHDGGELARAALAGHAVQDALRHWNTGETSGQTDKDGAKHLASQEVKLRELLLFMSALLSLEVTNKSIIIVAKLNSASTLHARATAKALMMRYMWPEQQNGTDRNRSNV